MWTNIVPLFLVFLGMLALTTLEIEIGNKILNIGYMELAVLNIVEWGPYTSPLIHPVLGLL